MAGPFGKQTAPSRKPKRNTFDLSHQNNLTMEFGKLYPFLCEPVIPGDSVRLDTAFGIRAMPTAFPLQTKIRADVHYFYVRNRNLWKDWPDFIGQTRDDLVLPYVTNSSIPFDNGSLADFFNIPTSFVTPISKTVNSGDVLTSGSVKCPALGYYPNVSGFAFSGFSDWSLVFNDGIDAYPLNNICNLLRGQSVGYSMTPSGSEPCNITPGIRFFKPASPSSEFQYLYVPRDFFTKNYSPYSSPRSFCFLGGTATSLDGPSNVFYPMFDYGDFYVFQTTDASFTFDADLVLYPVEFSSDLPVVSEASLHNNLASESWFDSGIRIERVNAPRLADFDASGLFIGSYSPDVFSQAGSDPRFSSLHINALPFRAYESIYNAFYRDDRNNPYILNGEKVYNKYLPTQDGGLDSTPYSLRSRNWEQDFLTTAVDSPQQGVAPLVGITSTGVASFALDDGSIEKVQLKVGDDGDTIVGAEYSNNLSPAVARQLVNVATSGISINDFRGVNALQRWLEINIRRGLKYKDQIESHFGVTPSYAELDMPEFLGGATQWFDSSQVNQTSEASDGSPLGSYAGQLSLVGGSNHPVTRFFDEHGYIIGIVSISPVPCYVNTLHADFLKSSPLDYYFPEFAHLGYQPIPYSQVSPLEYILQGENLSSTFGYQRAWYEYMSRTDEAHGDFRGDLRDFLLMRRFSYAPSLSENFLTIDQKQLNQVFTVNEIDGKPVMPFLGQIHIKEIFKRPIPRYQISTLE